MIEARQEDSSVERPAIEVEVPEAGVPVTVEVE